MHRKTIVKNPISFEFLWKNTGDVCFELVSVIFMFQSVSSVDVANRKSVCACAPLKKYFLKSVLPVNNMHIQKLVQIRVFCVLSFTPNIQLESCILPFLDISARALTHFSLLLRFYSINLDYFSSLSFTPSKWFFRFYYATLASVVNVFSTYNIFFPIAFYSWFNTIK